MPVTVPPYAGFGGGPRGWMPVTGPVLIGPVKLPDTQYSGVLRLAIAEEGDIFFSEDVRLPLPLHDLTEFFGIEKPGVGTGELWTDGAGIAEELSVNVDGGNRIISGYYEDTINAALGAAEYEVTVYLTYETEEETEDGRRETEDPSFAKATEGESGQPTKEGEPETENSKPETT